MAITDATPTSRATRVTRAIHQWWPVPACVAVAVVAQKMLLTSRYHVGGHAAEHLGSAAAPFMAAAVLVILFWATPGARRQLDVIAAAAAWFAMTMIVMMGNLRVIDDLVDAGYGFTPTSVVPDIADHRLANSSIWWAVAAGLLVVATFRWRGHIGNVAAIGTVTAMLFPPWIIPGAGVVVLMIVRCVALATAVPQLNIAAGRCMTSAESRPAALPGSTQ